MFNAPRASQPYGSSTSNGFGSTSFVVDNPLASSVYDSDGLDPWSTTPSPAPPSIPATSAVVAPAGFSAVIGALWLHYTGTDVLTKSSADSIAPAVYHQAFAAVDSTGAGETSVNGLSRVLNTSGLSASTIERVSRHRSLTYSVHRSHYYRS